jgi:hypothetical protein
MTPMWPRAAVCVCVIVLSAFPFSAEGSSMAERLRAARREYVGQEYERVIRLLTPVAQSPMATIGEKVQAYELLGLSYLILNDKRRARDAFENLLGLDPGHVLRDPSGSPKLKQFFESVKESFVPGYQAHATVTLEHSAPTSAVAGRTVEFAANVVRGERSVRNTLLRWRRAGLLTYRTVEMEGAGPLLARFTLPRDSTAYQLEYYIEARDRGGNTVARVGSPEEPLRVTVAGTPRRAQPFYKKWWFWTAVGAVVVGGVTATAVVLGTESAPVGNLGQVQLQ